MTKKLYVGNLPYQVDDEELKELFEEHGTVVSAQVIVDRETYRSKGFGFVEMGTEEEAKAAIEALNSKAMQGRPLNVNIAHQRESRGPRGGGQGGHRGHSRSPSHSY